MSASFSLFGSLCSHEKKTPTDLVQPITTENSFVFACLSLSLALSSRPCRVSVLCVFVSLAVAVASCEPFQFDLSRERFVCARLLSLYISILPVPLWLCSFRARCARSVMWSHSQRQSGNARTEQLASVVCAISVYKTISKIVQGSG